FESMLDGEHHVVLTTDDNLRSSSEDTQVVDTMDEYLMLTAPRKTKTVTVPRIQSMQDYILKHHKRMILGEINRQIAGGTLREIEETRGSEVTLRSGDCRFGEMIFWRHDTCTLLADISISAYVSMPNEVQVYDLYCELWVDMRYGMVFSCGECGFLQDKPERDMWMLSSYLVPILRKDEVEQGAEELLLRYCPKALESSRERDAYLLADRMGLKVERYPLYRKNGTLSILFFCEGEVTAEKQDDEGRNLDVPYTVSVPAGTIVINTNVVHKDCCQLEIYHECIHYDWHYMFFRLQDMHNSDVNTLKTKRVVVQDNKTPTNPLKWMEWQARRGSFGLMMPLSIMEPLVAKQWAIRAPSKHHAGQKFEGIARTIARDYDLPKFRVRARLLQMGHIAAKGALNYVDGRYIEPFAFSAGNCEGNTSFVIDRKSAFAIYRENEAFRQQLQSGQYIYVDGHICINDGRYVRQTENGLRLTAWANAHVDQCCLRFNSIYEPCGVADYRFGAMNSDEAYNQHYMSFAQGKGALSSREKLTAMTRLIAELPVTFHEALSYLMKRAHITIEGMEERTGISSRTISRMRTQERRDYSLDQVIAICVALQLPPWLSREMIAKAGFILRTTKQHQAYQLVLDCMFIDTVEDVQRFLVEAGCEKLRLNNLQS
ncbi:MAG: helix-turn-helix transcriptional regulator, partial [Clostridia bacterium]|nr:helix-turn-helix transcriptional regulator [Clostridia bacterium]